MNFIGGLVDRQVDNHVDEMKKKQRRDDYPRELAERVIWGDVDRTGRLYLMAMEEIGKSLVGMMLV